MTAYLLRRLLLFIPTVFIVVTMVFLLVRLVPGDIVTLMVQDNQYAASADALRERLGLTKPLHVQYGEFLGNLARGDLGDSLKTGDSAWSEVRRRAPVSLELGLLSLAISLTLAIPIGVLSAVRTNTPFDLLGRIFSVLMLAIPNFWLATLIIVVPSVLWNVTVAKQYVPLTEDPLANLRVMIVPALIAGTAASASVMRMTRTMVLDVSRQDYVRTAKAKGLRERVVVTRHMLKNALIPVVTLVGLQIPAVISGSVIMEQVFGLPGMGRFLLENISQRDYPMIQATTLIFALVVMTVNLAIDLSYQFLDPRVKLGGAAS